MIPIYYNHRHIHSPISVIVEIILHGDASHEVYYKQEGGDFFPNLNHVNVMNPKQVYDPKLISFAFRTT
jgi:hypothetical protein